MFAEALMVSAAGRVERKGVYFQGGRPPARIRYVLPVRTTAVPKMDPLEELKFPIINLGAHLVYGFELEIAYWPESWPDEWGFRELHYWQFGEYPTPEVYEFYKTANETRVAHESDALDAFMHGMKSLEILKRG